MTEAYITKALSLRHHRDIFVAQCKNGSTWFPTNGQLRIFDAWAMTRSYTNMQWVGYEIKVSRSDYCGDRKLMDYLPYCSEFYIVCPWKMLRKEEVPDPIGLMYTSPSKSMMTRIIKRAEVRQIDLPVTIYEYILMSRCKIDNTKTVHVKDAWGMVVDVKQMHLFEEVT